MQRILPIMVVALLWLTACGGELPIPPPDAEAPAQVEASAEEAVVEEIVAEEAVVEEAVAEEVAEEAVAEEAVVEEAVAEEPVAEEAVSEEAVEEVVAEAAPADNAPAVADIGPPPEFSPNLRASDPTQFVRANGKPQVLEFFAFW